MVHGYGLIVSGCAEPRFVPKTFHGQLKLTWPIYSDGVKSSNGWMTKKGQIVECSEKVKCHPFEFEHKAIWSWFSRQYFLLSNPIATTSGWRLKNKVIIICNWLRNCDLSADHVADVRLSPKMCARTEAPKQNFFYSQNYVMYYIMCARRTRRLQYDVQVCTLCKHLHEAQHISLVHEWTA